MGVLVEKSIPVRDASLLSAIARSGKKGAELLARLESDVAKDIGLKLLGQQSKHGTPSDVLDRAATAVRDAVDAD